MKMLSHTPQPHVLPHNPPDVQEAVQDQVSGSSPSQLADNMTMIHQPVIIVRAEEALIVVMVLVLWVAAIALFFNRWGKIRMLEPYQPKFIQQHRPSCPLVDTLQQQRSFSKFNINGEFLLSQPQLLRPRQNSVFVGSSMVTLPMNPPRKVKSAFDLKNLVLSDPALNRSVIRLNLGRDEIRRSSMLPAFEKAQCYAAVVPPVTEKAQCYGEVKRPESRNNSISSVTRRGSILPEGCRNVLSVDNTERTFLPPPIKSGVLDFRRNSMLIINNLTEEVAPTPFLRNISLGGSSVNLTPEFPPAPRRNSVIPPYVKHKQKSPSAAACTDKYITNQKASKSLDCETSLRKQSPAVSDLRRQFLHPVTQQRSSVSSEALTEFPKIIETICSSPVPTEGGDRFLFETEIEDRCSSQVNLLANGEVYYGSSAPDVNITSSSFKQTVAMTSSLTDLNPRSSNTVVTTTEADVTPTPYKVTNV